MTKILVFQYKGHNKWVDMAHDNFNEDDPHCFEKFLANVKRISSGIFDGNGEKKTTVEYRVILRETILKEEIVQHV